MAKKFFNQKIKKNSKKSTMKIIIIIIIVIVLLIILAFFINKLTLNNKAKNATIKIRESIAVEVNSELPDKTLFFAELENVGNKDIKIDFGNADIKNVGEYKVTLKVFGKRYNSTLDVVDTQNPELVVKNVSIQSGGKYSAEDFVDSCTDNSGKDCIIEFNTLSVNQDGEKIDYSSYTNEGTYTVQIIAKDESGNQTNPMNATLSIGATSEDNPNTQITCKFGGNNYDTSKYIMAVNVTENNCALDPNLYENENTVAVANKLIETETEKLKKEFNKINLNTTDVYLNSNIEPILNNEGTGLVGYAIRMDLSINYNTENYEMIESFNIKEDGTREYIVDKYLQQ